jgi:LmbE family N-acetylglucosaminyl deacetylase
MNFRNPTARIVVPDGKSVEEALARTTHLAIGAHQDDLEIMAIEGILACYQQPDAWFCGVIVTNGSGAPRAGIYGDYTDAEMCVVRAEEQIKAAHVGGFGAQVSLDYPSSAIKDGADKQPGEDLATIIRAAGAHTVYTHNLADKHDTHIGVTLKVVEAIRGIEETARPKRLLGCEVWRDLDWVLDDEKVAMDCSGRENLQAALLGVFDSQIAGGKRYDLAAMGRRRANATFNASHATDATTSLAYAMDLTPLIQNPALDPADYVTAHIDRFRDDVAARIARVQ